MPENIIEVENISKLYKLGSIGTGTLSHDLNRWWSTIRKKDDPYQIAGEINDRTVTSNSDYVWSLKNINFEIKKGEIFGIIGSNGAGKSTLLKILSKITKPTTGLIKLDGKIASLLEVGTGFHPELTGRENVFLNGAILGMRKQEIKDRFDEIVDFSGIGRYIDTPVKKYSSGMYVRLAFAVAAHLEPDILIIDEVLAVGDAEFQAKCMGKMKDVSLNNGRTVLFVSHNISAIKKLCNKALLLENGIQKTIGDTIDVLSIYQQEESDVNDGKRGKSPNNLPGYFIDWQLDDTNLEKTHSCHSGDICTFSFGFLALESIKNCEVSFTLSYNELLILNTSNLANGGINFSITAGYYYFKFKLVLPVSESKLGVAVTLNSFGKKIDNWASSTKLTVLDNFGSHRIAGLLNPEIQFRLQKDTSENVLQ